MTSRGQARPDDLHEGASARGGAGVSERGCVLFDFDGTLADTRPAIVATAERVLSDWGLSADQIGDAGRLVGPPFPAAFSMVYGFSEADAAEITRRYREIYNALGPESHPLFEGMADVLEDLRRAGRRLAVTTSKLQTMALRMLADDCILDLFDEVVGQTDPARADKASLVADTLDRLGTTADDAVMVGDRFYDVEGAHANGMPCVCVLFGTATRGELERAGAAAIATTAGELSHILVG